MTNQPLLRVSAFSTCLIVALCSVAVFSQESPPKTLRDQVHEKGSATAGTFSDRVVFGPYKFGNVVKESRVIVEGQVVAREAHLSGDEQSVYTDIGFTVYQILKDPDHLVKPKDRISVITPGGETNVDGGSVKVESGTIRPLKTVEVYILFLSKPSTATSYLLSNEFGAFHVTQNTVECQGHKLADSPCGKKVGEFYDVLSKTLAEGKNAQ